MKKILAAVLAAALCIGIGIGGTLAWLTDKTENVVNTFTVGNINIDLIETDNEVDEDGNANTNDYKMVPGNTITKDPKVTVKANSEASWLFVKIEESGNLDDFIIYAVADGWIALTGVDGVYYREVDATEQDTSFDVIGNKGVNGNGTFVANKVLVKDSVTKAMMDAIEDGTANEPTLTFTAYAVQKDNITTVDEAWTQAQNAANY